MIQPINITERSKKRLKPKKIGDTGLNLIRVSDEMIDFSNLTGTGDPEPGANENGLTESQQSYLDTLDKTKTKARERAPFLFNTPNKPELDEEQRKRYKNLTKVGAIAQLVDAVGDIALGAKNQDYRPVPIAGDELAFSGLQKVYEMDHDFRNEMRNYDQTVFNIDQENRQEQHQTEEFNQEAQLKAEQQNKSVDLAKVKTKLGFEEANEEARQRALKIANEQENKTKEWYRSAALRLVSNGEPETGLEMAKLGGMDTDTALKYLKLGGTEPKTVLDYYNDYLGRGKDDLLTNLELRMLNRYRELEQEISKDRGEHYAGGIAQSEEAKELKYLKNTLGNLRYAPSEEEIRGLYGESTPQDEKITPQDQESTSQDQKSTTQAQPKDRQGFINDNEALIQELAQTDNDEQQQQILQRLYSNGEQLGLSQDQVNSDLEQIFNPQSGYNQYQYSQIQVPGATEPSENIDINTEEGVQELYRYTAQVENAFDNTEEDEEKRAYLLKLGNVMESAGVDEDTIAEMIDVILNPKLQPLGELKPNDEESAKKIDFYKWQASRVVKNANTREELRTIANQIEQDLRDAGLPDEMISEIAEYIFGLNNEEENPDTDSTGEDDGGKGGNDDDGGKVRSLGANPDDGGKARGNW